VLWRGWGPFDDSSEFVETIPFKQTRDYVEIIVRNAELYRWLYAGEPPSPTGRAAAKPAAKSSSSKKKVVARSSQ
jgi:soluble lytic murein transglycosylase